jgi:hypothetical protein
VSCLSSPLTNSSSQVEGLLRFVDKDPNPLRIEYLEIFSRRYRFVRDNPKSAKKKMKQQTKSAVPVWYWVIAAVALLWNLMGCAFFGMELFAQEAGMAFMTEAQKEWVRSTPGWIYFVYGLAVSSGVVGSIGLFLRKGWTTRMFAISLVAVIVQMVYTMIIGGGLQVMGPSGLVMPAVVIGIAAALLWFSRFVRSRGWFGQVSPTV